MDLTLCLICLGNFWNLPNILCGTSLKAEKSLFLHVNEDIYLVKRTIVFASILHRVVSIALCLARCNVSKLRLELDASLQMQCIAMGHINKGFF